MFRLRLKELMRQKGMTTEQVATASGLSLRRIRALCHEFLGDRTRLSTVERLADVLGTSTCELVERIPDPLSKQESEKDEPEWGNVSRSRFVL